MDVGEIGLERGVGVGVGVVDDLDDLDDVDLGAFRPVDARLYQPQRWLRQGNGVMPSLEGGGEQRGGGGPGSEGDSQPPTNERCSTGETFVAQLMKQARSTNETGSLN